MAPRKVRRKGEGKKKETVDEKPTEENEGKAKAKL